MSILIKGMEIPQSCYDCPFQHPCKHDEDKDYCVVIDDFLYCYNMEANNCPLIEVPPHGRLIDADELFNRDMQIYYGNTAVGTRSYIFKSDVAEAPTVIPSDKEET